MKFNQISFNVKNILLLNYVNKFDTQKKKNKNKKIMIN